MVKRLYLFVLTLFVVIPCTGQPLNEGKSAQPFLLLDNYFSLIGNKSADVWGFRAGIEWKKKWRWGAGFNKLESDIIEKKTLPSEELSYSDLSVVKAKLYLRYYPVMAEYIFYRKDPWQFSCPFQLGYGQSFFQYFDRNNLEREIFKKGVFVFQPGINTQYKLLKWVGFTGGIGYRLMLINNKEVDTQMNSPVLTIGIRLFPGEVIKTLKE